MTFVTVQHWMFTEFNQFRFQVPSLLPTFN